MIFICVLRCYTIVSKNNFDYTVSKRTEHDILLDNRPTLQDLSDRSVCEILYPYTLHDLCRVFG